MNTIKLLTSLLILNLLFSSCSKEEIIEPCEKDNFGILLISNHTDDDFVLVVNEDSYGIIEKNITRSLNIEAGNISVEFRGKYFFSNVYYRHTDFLQSCDNKPIPFY